MPDTFTDADVTVGDGPLAVGGTLSLPRQPGPAPGVVLLAGSGPHDRDETIGRNKPLKDLAWGLASAGMAVLRFDKVTHRSPRAGRRDDRASHWPMSMCRTRWPRSGCWRRAVDAGRVFVAGHSLGGTVAPRVAAVPGRSVAGLVILAGGAQPLHWAAVRQLRYLASLELPHAAASRPAIEVMTRQAQADRQPGPVDGDAGQRAAVRRARPYWLDLRGYDPAAAAADAGQADAHRAGRPRLPGDRRRRPVQDGGQLSAAGQTSRSASTRPTTTCSSLAPAPPHRPNTSPPSTWILRSSDAPRTGSPRRGRGPHRPRPVRHPPPTRLGRERATPRATSVTSPRSENKAHVAASAAN